MMKEQAGMKRRTLLNLMAGAGVAPLVLPNRVFGQEAPSKKVNVGFIGIGWMGIGNLGTFLSVSDCRVVAVCDVDEKNLKTAQERVNQKYQDKSCKAYKDYRELLADKDIDAVCISTPDHWHGVIAIAAAKAGKDIYCEKPLSHTLGEGIAMVEAVTAHKRIWQTGSWQRSQGLFRWAAEIVQNGYVGKISRVEVGLPNGHSDFAGTGKDKPNCEVPAGVDYDMWVGPAQMMPFNPCRFHKNWRWNYNTGGGQLMDWVGHHVDIAHWGLANAKYGCGPDDRVGPLELKATADFPALESVWNTATKYRIECQYPNKVEMVIAGGYGDIKIGTKFIGENGWIFVTRGSIDASDKKWIREIQDKEKDGSLEIKLNKVKGHQHEFIECVKSRERTLTPVEVAQRSQTPGHLGYIAARLGRTIKWDAAKQEIINDPEASKMISRELRKPWCLV